MRTRANATITGLFVLMTLAAATAAIVWLSAPGVIRKQSTYYVYFDNAGGIRAGTDVLLAGRRVGQVVDLQSPVPMDRRPGGRTDLEVMVEVRVAKSAHIFRSVNVRLQPFGMLGELLIDFVQGDPASGVAPSGTAFVGTRVPGLDDAAAEATQRLAELRTTIESINALTATTGGDLRQTAENARQFTDTIKRQPWRLVWRSTKKYGDEPEEQASKKDEKKRKGKKDDEDEVEKR
jgi:ABC-type transporter Mla subunit MlaD